MDHYLVVLEALRKGLCYQEIWSCEYESFQRKILKKHYPNTIQYDDIRTLDNPGYVDIISGGFPCQDISVAGGGIGIKGSRSKLWSEMFRIIRTVRPKYAIIENSPALLVRGFERVLLALSEIGYNAEWQCISNFSFGYPHRRERVYIIAYSNEIRPQSHIWKGGGFNSIFKQWSPNTANGYSLSKRIHEMPACEDIRNGDGFQNWTHRVGSIGNSVNPTIAHYLFECIKYINHVNHYGLPVGLSDTQLKRLNETTLGQEEKTANGFDLDAKSANADGKHDFYASILHALQGPDSLHPV